MHNERDQMAFEIMKILLTTESCAIQRGSGNGGIEYQTEWVAFVSYLMADAMIEQSQGKGLRLTKG